MTSKWCRERAYYGMKHLQKFGKGAEDMISQVHIFQINVCDSNVAHLTFFKNIQVKQSFECRTSYSAGSGRKHPGLATDQTLAFTRWFNGGTYRR